MRFQDAMTMEEGIKRKMQDDDDALRQALGEMETDPEHVTLPSGLRIRLKRPSLSKALGGNPLEEAAGDEALQYLKISRGR